jgi:NADH:ubiquinone oxidoreductase subunit H
MEMETGPVSLITAITVVEIKETIIPLESSHWIFLGAPFLTFYLALVNWVVLPLEFGIAIFDIFG